MGFIEDLTQLIPGSPSEETAWDKLEPLFAESCFPDMKCTPQNPAFHREGDVYTHTQMVCGELVKIQAFHELKSRQKAELFLAAILHDIGKVKTTRMENGNLTSPHHASTGSRIAREFLWRDCGLCGTKELSAFRETVCALVRYHMLPVHLTDQSHPERRARVTAAVGELAEDFSWEMLCMLAEADVKGRIADDTEDLLSQVHLSRMLADDAGCFHGPYLFADGFAKHAYLNGRNVQPDQILYDGTWGEVIMLSGLPGTGKDTWIRRNHPDMPVVSPDGLRNELDISPGDNQGRIIQAAQQQAREYLRRKQPFIWNATDLTGEMRHQLTALFEQYGARVRIIYLETSWESRIARNSGRNEKVPETAVEKMLGKLVPPMPEEAMFVEWICV